MEATYEIIFEDVTKTVESSPIETWTLNETLVGLILVLVLYLSLVLKILPTFMKHHQPFQLNRLLSIYNAVQVISSVYIVFLYTKYVFRHGVITTRCPQGEDLKDVITDILPYFIAKHVDLLDTIFFILRKKQNQVTFLHVYHHSAMVGWTWFHYMYHPCDHFVVVGLINSFVHVIMYTYYWLASLGPEYARFIWWKKHLTKVQLIQFVLVISNLYYQQKLSPCPLPAAFHYYCLFCISSFFVLFINFYLQSYSKRRVSKSAKQTVKDD
ncbi:elongation of very long chain fatty acids protein 5-like isoform X1 [Pieris rapae]|uniref:elongation of very long chain fatty acids protein 5-like isoform X1 n=1 Tax=Pieris rapae TaxID=64459 RepID=UPI001E27B16E|nr:elongation of very long chain fatty acids protein 5-like isoform X1 [Pieris rapae]